MRLVDVIVEWLAWDWTSGWLSDGDGGKEQERRAR